MSTARQMNSLDELLAGADFVTLHVPESPETKNMIGAEQLAKMRSGSYLLNASRGSVVDIPALIDAMRSGHLAGAALDVYPNEPAGNGPYFNSELNPWAEDLRKLKNIILTPHIGGSTEEAQSAIGIEVASALTKYVNEGNTLQSVNMPELALRSLTTDEPNHVRACFIHKNIPGVLRRVNDILGDHNIDKQTVDAKGEVRYAPVVSPETLANPIPRLLTCSPISLMSTRRRSRLCTRSSRTCSPTSGLASSTKCKYSRYYGTVSPAGESSASWLEHSTWRSSVWGRTKKDGIRCYCMGGVQQPNSKTYIKKTG